MSTRPSDQEPVPILEREPPAPYAVRLAHERARHRRELETRNVAIAAMYEGMGVPSLEQVGQAFGISREAVRQIVRLQRAKATAAGRGQ